MTEPKHVIRHHFDLSHMGEPAELIYEEGDPRVQIGTEADGFVMVDLEALILVTETLIALQHKGRNGG